MAGRFDDWDGDYEDAWRGRLWAIDVERALATKPGYRALCELRDALLALPEKRLALGQACRVPFGEDDELDLSQPTFCAMGAWLHKKRVEQGEPEARVIEDLASSRFGSEDYGGYEAIEAITTAAKQLGMSMRLANHIQWVNDTDAPESEEHRYERVLAWTLAAIKKSPHYRKPVHPYDSQRGVHQARGGSEAGCYD